MLLHMQRTTIRLDDDLMRSAKRSAADRGITLTALIDEAIRERLARRDTAGVAGDWDLPTWGDGTGRVAPGVDFTSNESIQDFLDEGLSIEQLR
jgi:hypothetical protein